MSNMSIPVVAGLVVVALGSALWWTTRPAEEDLDAGTDALAIESPAGSASEQPSPDAASIRTGDSASATSETASSEALTPDSAALPSGDEPASADSPFAPVALDDGAAEKVVDIAPDTTDQPVEVMPDQASASASGTDTPGASGPSVASDAEGAPDAGPRRSGAGIEVPASYPIEDAAKYFVPPEERGPGNLGGPPPMDFPGGPNDPNRTDGGFAPPPAPGQ